MPPSDKDQTVPGLPDPLQPLLHLARDLRWTWRPDLRALFWSLDRAAWSHARGNALVFLKVASRVAMARAAEDPERDEVGDDERRGRRGGEVEGEKRREHQRGGQLGADRDAPRRNAGAVCT